MAEKRILLIVHSIIDFPFKKRQYLLVLESPEYKRRIAMIIGENEAQALAIAYEERKMPRPLSIQLLYDTLESLSATVMEVEISSYKSGLYEALVYVKDKDNNIHKIDARPSDAFTLALLSDSNISIKKELFSEICYNPKDLDENNATLQDLYKDYPETPEEMLVDDEGFDEMYKVPVFDDDTLLSDFVQDPEKKEIVETWLSKMDNKELNKRIKKAISTEKYEFAAIYNKELEKRKKSL